MADYILKNVKTYMDQYDVSGDMNEVGVNIETEMQDATAYGASARLFRPGLIQARVDLRGYLDYADDAQDEIMFADMGGAADIMTVAPTDGADGDPAYMFDTIRGVYTPRYPIGGMAAFQINAQSSGNVISGTIMGTGSKTSTGNGTARQLGAVAAGEKVYAALHCTAWNATTLDVIIESDDNSGMTSATTQITFTQLSALGSEFLNAAGAITDDWWRATWTLVGTSATIVVVVGIL